MEHKHSNDPTGVGSDGGDRPISTPVDHDTKRRRDALARNLCARICDDRRTIDELTVLDRVLMRVEKGADDYGPMDLSTDGRDFTDEHAEELEDYLAYGAMIVIARAHRRRERLACEAADELADRAGLNSTQLRTDGNR